MTVIGADRVRAKFKKLARLVEEEISTANERSGRDMVRIARVAHPGDGSTRAQIEGHKTEDGGFLVDFGGKAKVTEGDRGPRPFVNPTLKVTRKTHKGRARRAVNKAVKRSFGG